MRNVLHVIWRKSFWVIFVFDLILLTLCYCAAYWVRFDGEIDSVIRHQFMVTLIPLLICKSASFFAFDVYRGMWRYTSIKDLINIIKGAAVGSLFFVGYLVMAHHFTGFSRSVVLADGVFAIVAIGGFRVLIRLYYQQDSAFTKELLWWRTDTSKENYRKVCIVGTGTLGEELFREMNGAPGLGYKIVGFVGDTSLRGMKIHGVPILGLIEDIPDLVCQYNIDDVFIAIPQLESKRIKTMVEACSGLKVRFKTIPSLAERINGAVIDSLRDIQLEDLLVRDQVTMDMGIVQGELEGKTVLITGAGGSIGSELARQISGFHPGSLILLDNAETPLYEIHMELKDKKTRTKIIPCIGDIRTLNGLDRIFGSYKPHFVYHAAAYKHVPMMEESPLNAVNNNILGTYKLAKVACKHGTQKFVLISTDKAVRPTSIMGATKRVAEMIVQTMNGNGTSFVAVRFGNVLGSNGSVVPLFQKQITSGGPVTVTHPEITRYFMTIPEAVMLVLQAGAMGKGGELFLLDMGSPVKIVDLANNMIRLAGLVPEYDIKIEYIGLRPGEKLYEELLIAGEDVVDTAYDKIKVCNNAKEIDEKKLYEGIELFNLLVKDSGDPEVAVDILKRLVPAFRDGSPEQHIKISREVGVTGSLQDFVVEDQQKP